MIGKTSVEQRTYDPVWNTEMLDLGSVAADAPDLIRITVYHQNKLKSQVLCTGTVPVYRLIQVRNLFSNLRGDFLKGR